MLLRVCLTALLAILAYGDEIRRKNSLINTFRLKCDSLPYRTYFSMELGTCYVRYNDECTNLQLMFDPVDTPIERSVQNYLNKLGFPSMRNSVGFRTCKFAADIACTTSSGDTGSIVNGRCLQKNSRDTTYYDARASCANGGGRLFVPHSHEDVRGAIVTTLYGSSKAYWIGRTTESGRIVNIDHTDIDFYRWTARKDFTKTPFASALFAKYDLGNDGYNHGFEIPLPVDVRHGYICERSVTGEYIYYSIDDEYTYDMTTPEPDKEHPIDEIDPVDDTTPATDGADWSDAIQRVRMNGLPLLMANTMLDNRPRHYRYTVHPQKLRTMSHITPYSVSCGIVAKPNDNALLKRCPELQKRIIWRKLVQTPWTPLNIISEENNKPEGAQIQDTFYLAPRKGYCGANFELVEYRMEAPSERRIWIYYPPNEDSKTRRGYPEIANMKFTRSVGWIWKYPFHYDDLPGVVQNVTSASKIAYRFITSIFQQYQHVYTNDQEEAQNFTNEVFFEPPVGIVMPQDLYENNPAIKKNCPHLLKANLFIQTSGKYPNNWYGFSPVKYTGKYNIIDTHYCAPFRGYCGAYLEVYNIRTYRSNPLPDNVITSDEAEMRNILNNVKLYQNRQNPFGRCFIWTPDRNLINQWRTGITPLVRRTQPVIQANRYKDGKNKGFHVYTIDPTKQRLLVPQVNVGQRHGHVIDPTTPDGQDILRKCPKLFKLHLYQEAGGKGRSYIGCGKPRVPGNFKNDGTYYCAPYQGYCGANVLLWLMTKNGNNQDIMYTTRDKIAIENGRWPQFSYKICYVWNSVSSPPTHTTTTKRPGTPTPRPGPGGWKEAIMRIRTNGLPLLMANTYLDNRPKHYRYTVHPSKFRSMTHITPNSISCGIVAKKGDAKILKLCPELQRRVIWNKLIKEPWTPLNTISEPNKKPAGAKIQDEFYISPRKGYCGANFELVEYRMNAPKQKRIWAYYPPTKEGKTKKGYPEIANMKFTRSIGWIWKYSFYYPDLAAVTRNITRASKIAHRFITSLGQKYQHVYTDDLNQVQNFSNHVYFEPPVGILMSKKLYETPAMKKNCPHLLRADLFVQRMGRETLHECPAGCETPMNLRNLTRHLKNVHGYSNDFIRKCNEKVIPQPQASGKFPNNWYGYNPLKGTGKYKIIDTHYCAPFRGYCGAYLEVYNMRTYMANPLPDNVITADEAEVNNIRNKLKIYGNRRNPFGRCFIWTPDRKVMNQWKKNIIPRVRKTQPYIQANRYKTGKNKGFHVYTIDRKKQKELLPLVNSGRRHGYVIDPSTAVGKDILKRCPRLLKVHLFQEVNGKGRTHIGCGGPRVKGNFKKEGTYYCAPYQGYCGATALLWVMSKNGNNQDMMYTQFTKLAIQNGRWPQYSHRICYVWNYVGNDKITPPPRPPPRTTKKPHGTTKRPQPKGDDPVAHLRKNGLPLLMASSSLNKKLRHFRYTVVPQKLTSFTHTTPHWESCGIIARPKDEYIRKLCPQLQKRVIWVNFVTFSGMPKNVIAEENKPCEGCHMQDQFYLSPRKGYCGANFELVEYERINQAERRIWVYYPPSEKFKTKEGYPPIANMKFKRSVGWIWKYNPLYENLGGAVKNITLKSAISYRFLTTLGQNYQHMYTHSQQKAQQYSEKFFIEPMNGLVLPAQYYENNKPLRRTCPWLLKGHLYEQTSGAIRNAWFGYQPIKGIGNYHEIDTPFYCAPFKGYCGAHLLVSNVRTSPGKLADTLITSGPTERDYVMANNQRYQHDSNAFGKCYIWAPNKQIKQQWQKNIKPIVKRSQPILQANNYKGGANRGFHIYNIDPQKQKQLEKKGIVNVGIRHGRVIDTSTKDGKEILRRCPRLMKIRVFQEVGGNGRTHISAASPRVSGNFKNEGAYHCAPYQGYCGATRALSQIIYPNTNKDIVYTTNPTDANNLGKRPAFNLRVCFIWDP